MSRSSITPRIPWLTLGVLAANVAVSLCAGPRGGADVDALVRAGGKVDALVLDLGQLWRLLTANFLHKGALHLAVNLAGLLAVGGALENAYRRIDLALLLFASGLGALSASLWLSDGISVGASGMLFGCLGAVAVLYLQHRERLPAWSRRVLAEAGLPLALVLLGLGFAAPGVDRAAHAGGLLVGLGLTPLLRPRLLGGDALRPARDGAVALAGVGLTALLICGEGAFGRWLPPTRVERDDGFGIRVPLPRPWRRTANRLGQLAWFNGLPGYGRATFSAQVVMEGEPVDAAARARRFIAEALAPAALGPGVRDVSASAPAAVELAGREGLRVRARYREAWGWTELAAYFLPRGELLYQLVFTWPSDLPGYAWVVERMARGIALEEPRALREARARALLFPDAPWALGTLGELLRRLGEPLPAVEVLRAAVREEPSAVPLREQLARALLEGGRVEDGCRAAEDAVLYAPGRAEGVELQARCALARGDSRAALERLREAARLAPADRRLQAAVAALEQALDEERAAGAGGH